MSKESLFEINERNTVDEILFADDTVGFKNEGATVLSPINAATNPENSSTCTGTEQVPHFHSEQGKKEGGKLWSFKLDSRKKDQNLNQEGATDTFTKLKEFLEQGKKEGGKLWSFKLDPLKKNQSLNQEGSIDAFTKLKELLKSRVSFGSYVLMPDIDKDSYCYGVSSKWVRTVLLSHASSNTSTKISIDNKNLFDENNYLRSGLTLGLDILLISEEEWKTLVNYCLIPDKSKILKLKSSDITCENGKIAIKKQLFYTKCDNPHDSSNDNVNDSVNNNDLVSNSIDYNKCNIQISDISSRAESCDNKAKTTPCSDPNCSAIAVGAMNSWSLDTFRNMEKHSPIIKNDCMYDNSVISRGNTERNSNVGTAFCNGLNAVNNGQNDVMNTDQNNKRNDVQNNTFGSNSADVNITNGNHNNVENNFDISSGGYDDGCNFHNGERRTENVESVDMVNLAQVEKTNSESCIDLNNHPENPELSNTLDSNYTFFKASVPESSVGPNTFDHENSPSFSSQTKSKSLNEKNSSYNTPNSASLSSTLLYNYGPNTHSQYLSFAPNSKSATNRSFPPGAVGIHNMGNTCFMNSSLQCMSNIVPLTLYFLSRRWKKEINKSNPIGSGGVIAKAYARLLRQLWNPSKDAPSSIVPRDFRTAFAKVDSVFLDYYQHDSHEFMGFLFDILHEDLNRVTKKSYAEIDNMRNLPDSEIARRYWDLHKRNNNSIISDLFQGQYKSTIECIKCGNRSITFDAFMFLSLPIIDNTTTPFVVYYVDYSCKSPNDKFIKFELNITRNTTVKMVIVQILKKHGIDCDDYLLSRYRLVMQQSSTVVSILKNFDIIPHEISNKTFFLVKVNHLDYEEKLFDCSTTLEPEKNVVFVIYFVKPRDKKLTHTIWQAEPLKFPLLFSLPPIIKVPLPSSRIAQLKKQRLCIKDLLTDPSLRSETYKEFINVVGLKMCSMIVSNLKSFMNRDYVNEMFSDGFHSSNESLNTTDQNAHISSSVNIFGSQQIYSHSLNSESVGQSSGSSLFANTELSQNEKLCETDSKRQIYRKNRILDSIDSSISTNVKSKSSKQSSNKRDNFGCFEQVPNSVIYEPLVEKLYKEINLYISSPKDSHNVFPSYDFSGSMSDFRENRWSIPRLCNIMCFSSDSSDLVSTFEDYFSIEKINNGQHINRLEPCRSIQSFPNLSKVKNVDKTNNQHSPFDTEETINEGFAYSKTISTKSEFTETNKMDTPLTPTKITDNGENHFEPNQYEDSSTEASWVYDNASSFENKSFAGDSMYNFVFKVPKNGVLVIEWDRTLIENIFGDNLLCTNRSEKFSDYIEHPDNVEVCKAREEERKNKKNIDLIDCIKAFCNEETLFEKDSWLCPCCKSYQPIKKKLDLWSVPEVLVFHLKRFSGGMNDHKSSLSAKFDVFVDAKVEGLDLNDVIIGPKVRNLDNSTRNFEFLDNTYDLTAVSNHYGTLHSGHYFAYTKNPINNKWYCFDDSSVRQIDPADVVKPAAYILVYQRCGSSSLNEFKKLFHRQDFQDVDKDIMSPEKKEIESP